MAKDKIEIVLIGGSAGSLEALLQILPAVSKNFRLPVILILHRKQGNDSILTDLLTARTSMKVKEIEEKELPRHGALHIAPPDYHLLFEDDKSFSLDVSERVNYSRPSIDVAFQSAADVYRNKLLCILLSGANADGTDGFKYVRERGGITIAQSPESSEVSYMPEQAILANVTTHIMKPLEIADFLNGL